jgi:ectoine hydroxylase-related dioxygenase (phytanoyl-CoA dioxygenase family)
MPKLTAEQKEQLDRDGYLIFRTLLDDEVLGQLRCRLEELWAEEGEQAGSENYLERNTRRLANLANKGEIFRELMVHPLVLEAAGRVLAGRVRLTMMNARDALPFADPKMPYHCDTDQGGKPDEKGYLAGTAVWMLDPFTRQNGATRLVPGSHRSGRVPKEVLSDLYAEHPDEMVIEGWPGDVLFFNGHCWHTGGANHTASPRRAILVHYVRSDLAPRLDYRVAISPEVRNRLNPVERRILGLDQNGS